MQNSPKLKYKIEEQLRLLPRNISTARVIADLQISERTFYKDKGITLTDDKEIPAGRLAKYAAYFGVAIEDLFTRPTRIKSIHERTAKIKTPLK